MSSGHYIIVARNDVTGKLEFPLGNTTLYGMGIDPETGEYEEEKLVRRICDDYDQNWTISLYGRVGATYGGVKERKET